MPSTPVSESNFDGMRSTCYPLLHRGPYVGLLNMWNPFIPNLEKRLFTQDTGTGQAVCLISWWCLSLIHLHLQAAGCDVYLGIIVNFLTCLN